MSGAGEMEPVRAVPGGEAVAVSRSGGRRFPRLHYGSYGCCGGVGMMGGCCGGVGMMVVKVEVVGRAVGGASQIAGAGG